MSTEGIKTSNQSTKQEYQNYTIEDYQSCQTLIYEIYIKQTKNQYQKLFKHLQVTRSDLISLSGNFQS